MRNFLISQENFESYNLDRPNLPQSIYISPGTCSPEAPTINHEHLTDVIVGIE